MEGKKIAFIVVAIATVGGIAYYLNKNKQATQDVASETKAPAMSALSKEAKIKLAKQIASERQYAIHEATPMQAPSSLYDDVSSTSRPIR